MEKEMAETSKPSSNSVPQNRGPIKKTVLPNADTVKVAFSETAMKHAFEKIGVTSIAGDGPVQNSQTDADDCLLQETEVEPQKRPTLTLKKSMESEPPKSENAPLNESVIKENPTPPVDWRKKLARTKIGEIKPIESNVCIMLEGLGVPLGFNTMTGDVEITIDNSLGLAVGAVTESHFGKLLLLIQREGVTAKMPLIRESVKIAANENPFNPIQRHVEMIIARRAENPTQAKLNNWLFDFAGVERDGSRYKYVEKIARKLLIGLIARSRGDAVRMFGVPVFENVNGLSVERIFRTIGANWFNLIAAGQTVTPEIMRQSWIVELSGPNLLQGVDVGSLLLAPCVIVGTTRRNEYLQDVEGDIWPIRIETAPNLERLQAALPGLLTEAAKAFENGEKPHFDPVVDAALIEQARAERGKRVIEHPWQQRITEFLEASADKPYLQARDILAVIDAERKRWSNQSYRELTEIMDRLGWVKDTRRAGEDKKPVAAYFPKKCNI